MLKTILKNSALILIITPTIANAEPFMPPPTPGPQVEWTCSIVDNKTGTQFSMAGKIQQENIPRFRGNMEPYENPDRGKDRDIEISSGPSDFVGKHKYNWSAENFDAHRVTLVAEDSKYSPLIMGAVVYKLIFELQSDGTGAVIVARSWEEKLKPSDEYPSLLSEVFAVGNCKSLRSWPNKQ